MKVCQAAETTEAVHGSVKALFDDRMRIDEREHQLLHQPIHETGPGPNELHALTLDQSTQKAT
jgi:hypothetical protein